MKRLVVLTLLAALGGAPVAVPAQTAPAALAPDNVLFKRMLALNGTIRSYRADVHLDVALRTFPFISPSLDGSIYYKKPDKQAVVFDTVPALASQFKKVYPKIDPPGTWAAIYDVAVLGDDRSITTFRLVPKRNGRVEHLDVRVDDGNATIVGYAWTYKDGGSVRFDQTFTATGGNFLVDKQVGRVELPAYKADVTSNFSHYKLNVAIQDSVFEEK